MWDPLQSRAHWGVRCRIFVKEIKFPATFEDYPLGVTVPSFRATVAAIRNV